MFNLGERMVVFFECHDSRSVLVASPPSGGMDLGRSSFAVPCRHSSFIDVIGSSTKIEKSIAMGARVIGFPHG
jgi:hypothetical protein